MKAATPPGMLKLVENGRHGRDMIEILEEAIEQVKAGKLDGIILGKLVNAEHTADFDENDQYLAAAWADGIEYRDARFYFLLSGMKDGCFNPDLMDLGE